MKTTKLILTSLVLVLLIITPACRQKKTPVVTPSNTTTTMAPPIVDPPPPLPSSDTVEPPRDFVDDQPTEEIFPTDINEVTRYAHSKGYLRDAFYNYDEATLDDAAQSALTASANWLKSGPGASYNLLIEGHCDERGTEQYNLALGDKRANSAKDFLVTLGVDAGRIRTVSYGEERPFEEGHDDSSWSQNRRAHLVLVR
ncbi:MAG TPA: OmpA family protein [Thermoanaerobaculia bacterium]|nr:OmpA family protein [Thermoanaerobaculia bacterium]